MTDHFPDAGKMVPEALRLADVLEGSALRIDHDAAAELRRLHAENEALRNANADVKRFREAASCERDVRVELEKQVSTLQSEVRRLHAENEALRAMSFDTKRDMKTEALLWLCREMIRELPIVHPQQGPRRDELIQALNERLSNG